MTSLPPRDVLLVGCPDTYRLLVPAAARLVEHEADSNPAVVVVGASVANPIFEAQRLARKHRGSTFIVTAGQDRLPEIRLQLQITPFVPISTRVILDQLETVREAVERAFVRAQQTHRQRHVARRASQSMARPSTAPHHGGAIARRFLELYSAGRDARTRAATEALPEVAAEIVSEILSDGEHALERSAILGDWTAYVERLERRGRASFDLDVNEAQWTDYHARLRRSLVEELLARDAPCIAEMDRFLSRAQLTLQQSIARVRGDFARERRHTETVLYAFVESSADAVVTLTLDGTITTWNRGAEALFGHRAATIVGRHASTIVPQALVPELEEQLDSVRRGVGIAEHRTRRLHESGATMDVSMTLSPIRDDRDIVGTLCVLRDITREVQTQARAAAMLVAALDGIVTIDHAGTILEFNPAAERMFGHTAGDVSGRSLGEVIVPERLRNAHDAGLRRRAREPRFSGRVELPALHADGHEFPVEVSIVRLPDIEPPTFTGFIRDLTELKAAEAQLEDTIRTLERSNADLERFAAIASHDLQEPLRMVTSFMELLREAYAGKLDARADLFIGHAVDGAQRMKRLIDDLLEYSRVDSRAAPPSRVDLAKVLDRVKHDLAIALEEAGALLEYDALTTIWADEGQIEQLLRNLISNAIKFRHPERDPVVRIRTEVHPDAWRIVVEDNGVGFEPELGTRIFEMFQRLHSRDTYEGSGIGLAIAKRIVERHRGRIWAESSPGLGACFSIEIPRGRRIE